MPKSSITKHIGKKNIILVQIMRVCLDSERISVKIALFGLVVENIVMLMISHEM
jgi:hypothetical protein